MPLAWALLLLLYAKRLAALWHEPVWRVPVLVVESDDWGAGPLDQATALAAIQAVLLRHRDATGQPAKMTLGVILAVVDTATTTASAYQRVVLDDARLAPVLDALRDGIAAGVFVPQLHGMEHYWPPAVLAAAQTDSAVAAWLTGAAWPATEALPSALQSRWIDARVLPSLSLPVAEIDVAAALETATFARIFGQAARVAVPTTFVWNDAVERAWAMHGVRYIVTPGTRHTGRDTVGKPIGDGRLIRNGERSHSGVRYPNGERRNSGIRYLVRDQYFEPALGHDAARGLAALARQTLLGRPTLLETHRFNFIGAPAEVALHALDNLLSQARAAYPTLRFLSTEQIAEAMTHMDSALIETRLCGRLRGWLVRTHTLPRFARLARLTGLALLLWMMQQWTA
ncbi:hypothetical protein [Sulfuriferula sp.]|uniref:hypothetical protein n=1 Tax=Sulfuriferula sp. TaxID=2025307 RepID=UPI002731CCD2|nr:hypothetical protein [Sulfuriferula sp.]MDP2025301.1 hypothetical protein [Sulfuriferula sp.]